MRNIKQSTLMCSHHLHTLLHFLLLGCQIPLPHLYLLTYLSGCTSMPPAQGRRDGSLVHLQVESNNHLLFHVKMMMMIMMTLTLATLTQQIGSDETCSIWPYILCCPPSTKHHFAGIGRGYHLYLTQAGWYMVLGR